MTPFAEHVQQRHPEWTVSDEPGDVVVISHRPNLREQLLRWATEAAAAPDYSKPVFTGYARALLFDRDPDLVTDAWLVLVDAVTELQAFDADPSRYCLGLGRPTADREYVRSERASDVEAALTCLVGAA